MQTETDTLKRHHTSADENGPDPEAMLTVQELAALMKRPRRYVMTLIHTRQIRAAKFGGNSWRTTWAEWRRFRDAALAEGGVNGFRHATPSGGIRPGMRGFPRKQEGAGA